MHRPVISWEDFLAASIHYLPRFAKVIHMDAPTSDDIIRILKQYRSAVLNARSVSGEHCTFGSSPAGSPYFARAILSSHLDAWEGPEPLHEDIQNEYNQITADLAALEREGGRGFREELFRDLGIYTEAYRSLLWFRELGAGDTGNWGGMNLRDAIGILLDELEGEFPVGEIRILIATFDGEYQRCIENTGDKPVIAWQDPVSAIKTGERTGTS